MCFRCGSEDAVSLPGPWLLLQHGRGLLPPRLLAPALWVSSWLPAGGPARPAALQPLPGQQHELIGEYALVGQPRAGGGAEVDERRPAVAAHVGEHRAPQGVTVERLARRVEAAGQRQLAFAEAQYAAGARVTGDVNL